MIDFTVRVIGYNTFVFERLLYRENPISLSIPDLAADQMERFQSVYVPLR